MLACHVKFILELSLNVVFIYRMDGFYFDMMREYECALAISMHGDILSEEDIPVGRIPSPKSPLPVTPVTPTVTKAVGGR